LALHADAVRIGPIDTPCAPVAGIGSVKSGIEMNNPSDVRVFPKETMIRGQPASIDCFELQGQIYSIGGGPVTVVGLEDDWYDDVRDPAAVVEILKQSKTVRPDLFTFWQRMPDVEPRFPYHIEWEEIAVLPVSTYEHWWKTQIKSRVRNHIRKSEKEGLTVKEVPYDDDFVRGMTAIFNESQIRQGRRFWHFGKDFDTVKQQFSRFIFRERMIGAYFEGEMVGFMMLADAGRFALTGQIISSLKHRDKSPNNALMAKAVEICAASKLPYLIYLFWSEDSLAEFKRRCGFERVRVPRYYVPLTRKGALALKLGAQRGWKALVPEKLKARLKRARALWNRKREE
jgi:hypothetical protein